VGDDPRIAGAAQQKDRERLAGRLNRSQVRQPTGHRARGRGGLKQGQEVSAEPHEARQQEPEDNDQGTWHADVRPSSRATLERSQKPVDGGATALLWL